jgi:hypothetical protein
MTRDLGLLIIGIALIAWGSCGCTGADIVEPCSLANPEFAGFLAQCRLRVETECAGITDEACPAVTECDAEVDRRCSDD